MDVSRVSRVVRLLTTLQSGHGYSAEELSDILKVSRRTLFRDLQQLTAIGVPYKYENKTGGYRIDPDFFLPPVDLNLQEALSLLIGIHRGRTHLPLPFQNSLLFAGLKIENNLPRDIRQYCNASLQNISVKPIPHSPMDSLDNVFATIQKAIQKRHIVSINYHSLFEQKDVLTELCPYHLMYNNRAWYVIGSSSFHKNSMRTFKLNRIRSLEVQEKCFSGDQKFDYGEYVGRAWAMIPEGKIYNVRLMFRPKVAQNVAEVHWHSTQQVTFHDDGSAIIEFRVDGLNEIYWWILGYGDQVNVLAPDKLKKMIFDTAKNMIDQNKYVWPLG